MDLNTVKALVKLLKDEDLTKLKVENDGLKVEIERESAGTGVAKSVSEESQRKEEQPADPSNYKEITAPQIGTFYTKKDEHSSETFIKVGDRINVGDQIGYIEAMKMFSNLKSDISGIVREIVASNGEDVEYGEVLVLVEPEDN